jgi:hypothetical protein
MVIEIDYTLHVFRSPKFQSVVQDAIKYFTETPLHSVPPERFVGAGIYSLYYVGGYKLYARIADMNRGAYIQPIYIGKAVPLGWRTARSAIVQTPSLYTRLREHGRSIRQTNNLDVNDFRCRFMILGDVESDLIIPVEAELIRKYMPLWNTVVDGFGNHDPGWGRYNQARSEWDILHPGRLWTERLTRQASNLEDVTAKVENFLSSLFS